MEILVVVVVRIWPRYFNLEKKRACRDHPPLINQADSFDSKIKFFWTISNFSQNVLGSERVKHEEMFHLLPRSSLGPGRILTHYSFHFLSEGAIHTEADRQNGALIIGETHIVSPLSFLQRPCGREHSFKLYFSQCFPKRTWQMNSILLN